MGTWATGGSSEGNCKVTKNAELGILVPFLFGDSLRGQGLERETGWGGMGFSRSRRGELEVPIEHSPIVKKYTVL